MRKLLIILSCLTLTYLEVSAQVEKNGYVKNRITTFGTLSKTIGFLSDPTIEDWSKLNFYNEDLTPYEVNPKELQLKDDYLEFAPLRVSGNKDGFLVVPFDKQKILLFEESDTTLVFRNWSEHITSSVSGIGFNPKKNPIRERPTKKSKKVEYIHDTFYIPVRIEGDWLLIKEYDREYGWIMWRNEDLLLIDLFYLM